MEKNPFNELISQIKEISRSNITENKMFNIGVVVSPLPDLVVKTSNIELDKDNLMIDKWLLDRHWESKTYTAGEHEHTDGSHAIGKCECETTPEETTPEGTGGTTGTTGETTTGTTGTKTEGKHRHYGGDHFHESKDYVNKLNVGDKVIMLREGDMFYIISKVVSIDGLHFK